MSTPEGAVPGGSSGAAEKPEGMEEEAALLSSLAEIPNVAAAWCRNTPDDGGMDLTVLYTQRNLPANAMRKYVCSYHVTPEFAASGSKPPAPSFPLELKDVVIFSPSPSGKRVVISRAGVGDAEAAILEIWGGSRLLKELRVPKSVHGSLFNDGWFGTGAAWSPDETKLAYVAEEPASSKTPEWGGDGRGKNGTSAAAPKTWRGVGEHQDDWGELFTGKKSPAVFVLDLASWTVSRVGGLAEGLSVGQPTFAPSGNYLVVVGWPNHAHNFPSLPERLGIVYCVNRPCALYLAPVPLVPEENLEATSHDPSGVAALCLTAGQGSALSPRFSPCGDALVFLSHDAAVNSGVHCATAALLKIPWDATGNCAKGPPEVLVPVVETPDSDPGTFPGLYATVLLPAPFIDDSMLVVNTQWRSRTDFVVVKKEDGCLVPGLNLCREQAGSWMFLASCTGWAIATYSTPNQASQVYVAHIEGGQLTGTWQDLSPADGGVSFPCLAQEALDRISYTTLLVKPQTAPMDLQFEVVVVRGSGGEGPAIMFPHGGPHSSYPASYMIGLAFLAGLGYTVLAVNFRGSTGFGEACIQSLPGKVGENDVSDCMAALDAAIAEGWVDASRVAVVGGSHGGFLSGHLVGQHPGRFRAAALRNPVLDISLMVHVSDIPDWTFIETWGTEEGKKRASVKPTSEDLDRFRKMSPIAHVDKVTAALTFMLGAKDRRVPQVDAQRYVAALRARPDAPPTSVFVFPEDTHALDKPQTEFEQWLNIAAWLKKYM